MGHVTLYIEASSCKYINKTVATTRGGRPLNCFRVMLLMEGNYSLCMYTYVSRVLLENIAFIHRNAGVYNFGLLLLICLYTKQRYIIIITPYGIPTFT